MKVRQLLDTLADLEARIAKLYERFAAEFHQVADVGDLWSSMSREELRHAEHLSLAAGTAPPATVSATTLADHLAALEAVVVQYERQLAHPVRLQEALQATLALEEAEAEHLHVPLPALGEWARRLAADPVMQHHRRHLLEHAIELFGSPATREHLALRRFQN